MLTRTCIVVAMVATVFALLPISLRVSAADEPLLVIVGSAFPANDIAMSALKDSFSGRATTIGGKRLIPINHPPKSPLRVVFDKAVLGLDQAGVGRFWVDKRIRAEGTPPTTASTPELSVRIVASLPNAISYATKSMLNSKVKTLTVSGKAAADAAYPIQH